MSKEGRACADDGTLDTCRASFDQRGGFYSVLRADKVKDRAFVIDSRSIDERGQALGRVHQINSRRHDENSSRDLKQKSMATPPVGLFQELRREHSTTLEKVDEQQGHSC